MDKPAEKRNPKSVASRESEAALIIRSDNPHQIVDQIASLEMIGGYRLRIGKPKEIHDIHFDTKGQALQAKRVALRIRRVDDESWITLKGPGQPNVWGGVERAEIEVPWSPEALARVLQELRDRGVELESSRSAFECDPMKMMANLGFVVIQNRETHRQVRNILPQDESDDTLLAELAIDSVTFHFDKQDVRLHEVEIEQKSAEDLAALGSVTANLLKMYSPLLRPSESKLATGRAIQALMQTGALAGLLDDANDLKPAAYDVIDRYLKRDSIWKRIWRWAVETA